MHVEDTGVGISAADLPLLFSRFGKLHRTAELNNEGIGLGLTIVKQIVEASGGSIIAESGGPNRGSCFIFSMQMRPAMEAECNEGENNTEREILDDGWESQLGGKLECFNNESSFINEESFRGFNPKEDRKVKHNLVPVQERLDSDEIDLSYRNNGDEQHSLTRKEKSSSKHFKDNRDSIVPLNKQSHIP